MTRRHVLWLRIAVLLLCGRTGLSQRALILEPTKEALNVTEVFRIESGANSAVMDGRKRAVQFYVPKAGLPSARATIHGPDGAAARLPLEKTTESEIFRLTYPARPGVTMLEIRYALPESGRFSGRTFGPGTLRLVASREVTLSGKNVRFLASEPRSQAKLYELTATPGEPFEIFIDGEEPVPERQPKRGPARIFERLHSFLALTCALLVIGGTLLYRRTPSHV